MKTQIHAKNKKKIIIFLFLIILLGSGGILFYFFYSNKEIETTVSFLNIDDTEVDSLLQTMSLEQKVTQLLIISSADTISLAEDISLGGIFIETNNFNHYKKYFNSAHKENVQSPLICSKSDILLPNFLNKYYNLPDFNSLISLSDSLLLEKYINFANSQDSVLGINFRYLSFINDISDTLNSDTNLINLYDKFASKLVQIAINHNQLICLPYLYTPSGDTILHQIQNRFYSSLLSNGLPAIYLQEEKAIEQFMLNYKFNGLLIRNADISNYEDFLKSDFDVIIVDSSYEKVYANILKTAKSKRKFKKLLDKKVKKILLAKTWLSQNHSITNKIETKASELYDINTDLLFHKIKKKSLIVFNNTDYFIPIKNINKKTICYIL